MAASLIFFSKMYLDLRFYISIFLDPPVSVVPVVSLTGSADAGGHFVESGGRE